MIRLSKKLLSAGVTLAAAALLMSGCKSTAEAPQVYRGPIIAQVNKNKENVDVFMPAVARAASRSRFNYTDLSASPGRVDLKVIQSKDDWVKLRVSYNLDQGSYSVEAIDSSARRQNGLGQRGDNSTAKRLMASIGWVMTNPDWQPRKLSDKEYDVMGSLYEEAEAKRFEPLPYKAVVFLWRNNMILDAMAMMSEGKLKPAYLDGKCFGLLRPGSFYRLEVEPGIHYLSSGYSNAKLNLEAGKIYYFHLNMYPRSWVWLAGEDGRWGAAKISKMTEKQGQNAIMSASFFKNGFCARPNLSEMMAETPIMSDDEYRSKLFGPDSSNSAVPAEDSGAQGAGTGTGTGSGSSVRSDAGDSSSSDNSTDAGNDGITIKSTSERASASTGAGAGRNTNPAAAAGKATGKPSGASAITGKTNGTGAVSSQKTDAAAGKTAGKSEGADKDEGTDLSESISKSVTSGEYRALGH